MGNKSIKTFIGVVLSALLGSALAEDGVSAQEIKIGMANALSGPAAGLGWNLKNGAVAYLDKINAAGGVNGRKIKLISVDDGYEPQRSAAATKSLIEEEKVFALFGYVGTPTSTAALPIATKAGVPYLFPFTGAEFLRNPVKSNVFNLRASYFDETEAMVEHLTKTLGLKKIALFIQDDAFGEAGKAGVSRAMAKRGLKLPVEVRYKRNTLEVGEGLAKLKGESPDAVVFIGTYKPFAQLLKSAKAEGFKSRFLTVSFIGTADLIKDAGADGDGVIISQVMPAFDNANIALVKNYQADVKADSRNYGSLEGYADAVVLVNALKAAGPNLTRSRLMETLESLDTDIGGIKVRFSKQNHQGSSAVFLTQIQGGKAIALEK